MLTPDTVRAPLRDGRAQSRTHRKRSWATRGRKLLRPEGGEGHSLREAPSTAWPRVQAGARTRRGTCRESHQGPWLPRHCPWCCHTADARWGPVPKGHQAGPVRALPGTPAAAPGPRSRVTGRRRRARLRGQPGPRPSRGPGPGRGLSPETSPRLGPGGLETQSRPVNWYFPAESTPRAVSLASSSYPVFSFPRRPEIAEILGIWRRHAGPILPNYGPSRRSL